MPRYTVYPKTHYATTREAVLNAIETIKVELKERLDYLYKANKLVEAQRLQQRTQFDVEMMAEVGYCQGIENYSRHLTRRSPGEPPPTLFDYLPPDALLVVDESHVTIPQLGAMYKGDRSRKETLVEFGFRLPSAMDNRPLKFDEWEQRAPRTVFVSATPGPYEAQKSAGQCRRTRGAPDRTHRSGSRSAPGAYPGRRSAVAGTTRGSRLASVCWSRR